MTRKAAAVVEVEDDEEAEVAPVQVVSAGTLGVWLGGLNARQIRELGSEGKVVRVPGGYDLQASIILYVRAQREVASGRGGTSESREAKRRLDEARAKVAEAKALREMGETVNAAVVEKRWTDTAKIIRSRMLAVGQRIAQRFGHLTREEIAAIEDEIRDGLTMIADEIEGTAG